jgi:Tfp pilus assembly protein PilO
MVAFFIIPSVRQIIKMNEEITRQRVDLEKKSSLGLNIKKIKTDLKEIEDNIGQLDSFFISPGKELDFISSVETLGNRNEIKLDIKPQFPGQDMSTRIKIIPLQISASGQYGQIQKFMLELESLPYYYNIDSISQNGTNENTQVKFTGNVYSLK